MGGTLPGLLGRGCCQFRLVVLGSHHSRVPLNSTGSSCMPARAYISTQSLACHSPPPPAGGGLSADDIRAAMRAAEDEGDAAAAVAVEREAAAEMDEFVKVSARGVWGAVCELSLGCGERWESGTCLVSGVRGI